MTLRSSTITGCFPFPVTDSTPPPVSAAAEQMEAAIERSRVTDAAVRDARQAVQDAEFLQRRADIDAERVGEPSSVDHIADAAKARDRAEREHAAAEAVGWEAIDAYSAAVTAARDSWLVGQAAVRQGQRERVEAAIAVLDREYNMLGYEEAVTSILERWEGSYQSLPGGRFDAVVGGMLAPRQRTTRTLNVDQASVIALARELLDLAVEDDPVDEPDEPAETTMAGAR